MRELALMLILVALGGRGIAHGQTAPVITGQPASQTVDAGRGASLSVTASGDPSPSYQWFFNGAILPGRTSSVLNLSNLQTTNQGGYFAVASNIRGTATSEVAQLTVITNLPVFVEHPTNLTVTVGQVAALSVTATGLPPPRYQWSFDGVDLPGRISSDGKIVMSFHSFVLETGRSTIVIDTCCAKSRPGREQFDRGKRDFLGGLAALGVTPEECPTAR